MVNEIIIAVAALLAGAFAGRLSGKRSALARGREEGRTAGHADGLLEERNRREATLRELAGCLSRGELPADGGDDSALAAIADALRDRWTLRDEERRAAFKEAVARVSGYLDSQVKGELAKANAGSGVKELREVIRKALGNLADVRSFLEEPKPASGSHELVPILQAVAREFGADQGVRVMIYRPQGTLRVAVNPDTLKDALYLIFHNAARFGRTPPIKVVATSEGGRSKITVTDRGEGFSAEAKRRAFDPFYSTAPDGLGLGLPHARGLVEAMGGAVELGNAPEGGGVVTLSFDGS